MCVRTSRPPGTAKGSIGSAARKVSLAHGFPSSARGVSRSTCARAHRILQRSECISTQLDIPKQRVPIATQVYTLPRSACVRIATQECATARAAFWRWQLAAAAAAAAVATGRERNATDLPSLVLKVGLAMPPTDWRFAIVGSKNQRPVSRSVRPGWQHSGHDSAAVSEAHRRSRVRQRTCALLAAARARRGGRRNRRP